MKTPAALIRTVRDELGPVQALVMSHAESVSSSILDTTVESFDRHFAVNARASWLLIKAFAEQYDAPYGDGRIVAFLCSKKGGWINAQLLHSNGGFQ